MTDLVPSDERISRQALERIIQRAAELQASEREIGDQLTEQQLMDLGRDVGLPDRYVQQALWEERSRMLSEESGPLRKLVGPRRIVAQRTVLGEVAPLQDALSYWMTEQELLIVKRRFRQGVSWEPRKDWMAALKRGMGVGGKKYVLTRAKEVAAEVRQLENGWCHVTLTADLSNSRSGYLGGASAIAGVGTASALVWGLIGVAWPLAVLHAAAGVAGGYLIARARHGIVEQTHVGLEQVLDRLEHGEASPPKTDALPPGRQLTKLLRDEIRRHIGQ
jgi:hypothetical protein